MATRLWQIWKLKSLFAEKVWTFRPLQPHTTTPQIPFRVCWRSPLKNLFNKYTVVQVSAPPADLYTGESPMKIVLTWLCYYVVIVWLSAGLFLLSLFWTQPPPPRKLGDLCRLNIFSLSFVKYTWIFFLIATDSSLSQTIRFVFSTHFRNEKSELLVFVQNANFCFLLPVIDCFLFLMF